MIKVRNSVFETNSSSTHSLSICLQSDYDKWVKGELYYSEYKLIRDKEHNSDFYTKEEVDSYMRKNYASHWSGFDSDNADDLLRENDIFTIDSYDDYYGDRFETYNENFTTPSGDKIKVFGYYGYDG